MLSLVEIGKGNGGERGARNSERKKKLIVVPRAKLSEGTRRKEVFVLLQKVNSISIYDAKYPEG